MPALVSPIYGFQLLQPSQSQPEVPVNTALRVLEAMTNLSVASRVLAVPPGAITDGICYVVPSGASGLWTGEDNKVAVGANGAWLFVTPRPGQEAYVQNEDTYIRYQTFGSPSGWIAR